MAKHHDGIIATDGTLNFAFGVGFGDERRDIISRLVQQG
jgi:hypothetical protein